MGMGMGMGVVMDHNNKSILYIPDIKYINTM